MITIFHLHFSKHILIIKSSHLVWATINKKQQIVNQLQATLYENNITGAPDSTVNNLKFCVIH